MHALVSRRYVVIEDTSTRGWRLLAAFGHERLFCQAVELLEPCGDVGEHRLNDHGSSGATDSHGVPLETELPWNPHGLAPAVLEKLRSGGHDTPRWHISAEQV